MLFGHNVHISLDLHQGPVDYRVHEDDLELTVGDDFSTVIMHMNLSLACVATLSEVFNHMLPKLRENNALIANKRLKEATPTKTYTVTLADHPKSPSEHSAG